MPRTGVAARLISNSRWNLIAFGVALIANVLTIPIAIAAIGLEAFGAAGLVLAVFAPFTLVGTVIGQALVRELAPRMATGDRDGCVRILSAAVVIALIGCALVVAVLSLAGRDLMGLLTSHSAPRTDWTLALLVCGLGWVTQQGCLILQSAVMATQNYGRLAIVSSIGAVAGAIAVVLATRAMPNATGYLLGVSIGFVMTTLVLTWLVCQDMAWLLQFRRWQRADWIALLEFGKWQGAAHFAGGVGNQIDRYVLGVLSPLAVVGQYNVAMRLQEVVHMGVLKMTEVLFPHFSVTATDPLNKRASFFVRASWMLNLVAVACLAPLIPLADPLITLWVGADAAHGGAPMLRTLATAGVIGGGINVYIYFAMASGQSARIAGMNIAHSIVLVASSVLLITLIGPMAAGAGYVLANLLRLAIATRFTSRYFRTVLRTSSLLQCTVPPLAGGMFGAWLLVGAQVVSPPSWPWLAFEYALIAIAVAAMAILCTAVSDAGRRLLRDTYVSGRQMVANRR